MFNLQVSVPYHLLKPEVDSFFKTVLWREILKQSFDVQLTSPSTQTIFWCKINKSLFPSNLWCPTWNSFWCPSTSLMSRYKFWCFDASKFSSFSSTSLMNPVTEYQREGVTIEIVTCELIFRVSDLTLLFYNDYKPIQTSLIVDLRIYL